MRSLVGHLADYFVKQAVVVLLEHGFQALGRALKQVDFQRGRSGQHCSTIKTCLALLFNNAHEWEVDDGIKKRSELLITIFELLKLFQGDPVTLQRCLELELLEVEEQIGMLVEVWLQIYILATCRDKSALIGILARVLLRLALELLLEPQVGNFYGEVDLGFHLFDDLRALEYLQFQLHSSFCRLALADDVLLVR